MKAIKNGQSRDKGNIRHKKRRMKTNITQRTKKMHGAHGNNIFLDFEWFHDIIKPEINPI